MQTLIVLIYLTSFLFACEFCMALYNFWAFLIKQRKYKTWPLLMFYILIILLSAMRTYQTMYFFAERMKPRIVEFLFPPILNINLGVV